MNPRCLPLGLIALGLLCSHPAFAESTNGSSTPEMPENPSAAVAPKATSDPALDAPEKELPPIEFADADSIEPPNESETLYEELAGEEDDTVILPSINFDHSFSFKDDTETGTKTKGRTTIMDKPWKYTAKFTGNYSFGGPKRNDWGIKMTVPFVYDNPGNVIKKHLGDLYKGSQEKFLHRNDEFGLGDVNFKIKRAFPVTKKLRAAVGFYVGLPTAEEYEEKYYSQAKKRIVKDKYGLGQNQYRFEQDLALSLRAGKILTYTLTTTLKEGHRIGKDETQYGIVIKPGINVSLPAKFLLALHYTAKYSFTDAPEQYTHDIKVKLNKRLGKLNVGIGYQNPLNIDSHYAHQVDMTMSYNF